MDFRSISRLISSLLIILIFLPVILQAQTNDFTTRVIQDYLYNMHYYRDKLLNDRHRPTYHFVIPEGYAHPFDPNGALYHNGRYHLFYIIQPYKPRKGHRGDCWAHISSHDLVHWRHHPTALRPGDGPEVAVYSGNVFINKEGVPTAVYQGLGAGNSIAYAQDKDLNSWKKSEANPVIPYPEFLLDNDGDEFRSILDKYPDYGKYDIWDPHIWIEGDTYYQISGDNAIWPAQNTTLWKSKDLENWTLVGDFFHHGGEKGHLDCPDFFKLNDKYVLIYLAEGVEYIIGDYKNEQFYPEIHSTMTWKSGAAYAPESVLDNKGRRIMWAALNDARVPWGSIDETLLEHGWCGMMSMPRVLDLDEHGLLISPPEEMKALRHSPVQLKNMSLADREMRLDGISGDALELQVEMDPGKAETCGIKVRCAPDDSEETIITYDALKGKVIVDLSKTTTDKRLMDSFYDRWNYRQEAPLKLKKGESLNFHIFLDKSVMEVFVNNRLCLTHRIYPANENSTGVVLFSKGGKVEVPSVNAWKMHPSMPY